MIRARWNEQNVNLLKRKHKEEEITIKELSGKLKYKDTYISKLKIQYNAWNIKF